MADLKTREYLLNGGTLEDLTRKWAIKVTPGKQYSNLVGLKYHLRDSPLTNPIVRECRGLVLDRDDDYKPVARGFDKFFNYGEPGADDVDWATAEVQEKIDGTLILLYEYDGQYLVATTGHPEAGGPVLTPSGSVRGTFAELFWRELYETHDMTATAAAPWLWRGARTAMIEMATAENRLVCGYAEPRLVLLGAREPQSGTEYGPWQLASALPAPRTFPLLGTPELIALELEKMRGTEDEGVVVVDRDFRRVKFKAPAYLSAFRLRFYSSVRSLVDVARNGGEVEVLAAFSWLYERVIEYRALIAAKAVDIEREYTRIRHLTDRKAFALEAVKTSCPAAMFAIRDGQYAGAVEYLNGIRVDALLALLNLDPKELSLEIPDEF